MNRRAAALCTAAALAVGACATGGPERAIRRSANSFRGFE
jgi:hypothetical protein